MILFHERWRARARLLAASALPPSEAAVTRLHLAACAACTAEHEASSTLLAQVAADRAGQPALPIPLAALVTRVHARLDEDARRPVPAWRARAALAMAASVAVVVIVWPRADRAPVAPVASTAPAPAETVSEDTLRRLEGRIVRDQAARYLTDAQDVLVNVAASPQRCTLHRAGVDMEAEARRSRELLAQRALLVEVERPEVAGARDVLDDVESALRDVAALGDCAQAGDLDAISRRLESRRLLMKIDLVTRELRG